MVPLGFRLKNFCQQKDTSVNYNFGITGLIGNNGHGKSNLIDAGQFFAWTGQVTKDKKEDYLSWGASSGFTQAFFIEGNKTYTLTRNLHNAGCSLKWEDSTGNTGEEKGIKVVDKILEEDILGMPFDVFRESKFCAQTSLIEILNMTSAKRLEYFQRLAGVQRAEILRGILLTKSNELPNIIDVSADIQQLEKTIADAENTAANAEKEMKRWTAELPAEGAVEALGRISQTLKTKRRAEQVEHEISSYRKDIQAKEDELKQLDIPADLKPVEGPTTEDVLAAQHLSFIAQNLENAQALTKQLKSLIVPAELAKPDTKVLEDFRDMLAAQRPIYEMAKSGVCPTCKRSYTFEEDPTLVIRRFEDAEKLFVEASADLQRQQTAYQKNNADIVRALASRESLEKQLATLQADTQRRQSAIPADFDIVKYKEKSRLFDDWRKIQSRIAQVKQKHELLTKGILSAQLCISKLEQESVLTDEEATQLMQEKSTIEHVLTQLKTLQQTQVSMQALVLSSKSQLQRLLKQQQQFQVYNKIRNCLEGARSYLHRDVLPKFVMSRLLNGMNSCLAYYLARFNAPYSARIDENFQFKVCFRRSSGEVNASRLSGGESVALVVAFRFALAELLGKAFPLLVMDEPTAWLDQEKKQVMVDVLKTAKGFAEKGSYVFVVTHDHILLPAMTRTLEIS